MEGVTRIFSLAVEIPAAISEVLRLPKVCAGADSLQGPKKNPRAKLNINLEQPC